MVNFKKVFSSFFPVESKSYDLLRQAIEKLSVNDSSVSLEIDSSPVLGQGYRIGFLGLLHMDIFKERLEQEFKQQAIVTMPNVPYKIKLSNQKLIKQNNGLSEIIIFNPLMVI